MMHFIVSQVGHEQPPAAPDGDMSNQQPISIVNEIVGVADRIKETAKMVRQNKDKCLEIDERAGIVSAFLTQLENTDVIKDPALSAKLKKIVNTFQHAYELVTGCQEWKNLFMIWPGQLSKELHKVLDQMVLDLDGITEISIRYTKGSHEVTSPEVWISATLMAGLFVVKLMVRQRSKTVNRPNIPTGRKLQGDNEEIEAVASANESVKTSLLQGGTTSEAPGASSKDYHFADVVRREKDGVNYPMI